MSEESPRRSVTLQKVGPTTFVATNARGGQVTMSTGEDGSFTPGEMLLAAIGACTGIDVDILTSRRADSTTFDIEVSADKIRDDLGNHLGNIMATYDVTFPDGDAGDKARGVLPQAIERSRKNLCTVGRTIEIGTPIRDELAPVSTH